MTTLVLAHESPLPGHGGSAQRVLHQARQLAERLPGGVEVRCLGSAPAAADEPFGLRGVPHQPDRRVALLRSVGQPYLSAWSRSPALEAAVDEGEWDLVVVTSPFLVRTARRPGAPVVLDVDNVEHEVASSMAEAATGVARLRWRWEASKIRRLEAKVASEVEAVTAPSDHDATAYRALGAPVVDVAPNGVDVACWPWRPPPPGATVGYVGQYGYQPNEQAALLLVDEILPLVCRQVPEAEVSLIGRAPTAAMRSREGASVQVTGALDDLVPAVQSLRALAVPLQAGGGTRLKILEAMAAGVPVVSTTLGASGLDVHDGEDLLLADTSEDMADALVGVLADDDLAARLATAGRALVEDRYDWAVTATPLVDRCRTVLDLPTMGSS